MVHAPVGKFRANSFGLHDVHGNLWEWCRDWHETYTIPARPGDGLRGIKSSASRLFRGGSFYNEARKARSAFRYINAPTNRSNYVGLRPSRAIK